MAGLQLGTWHGSTTLSAPRWHQANLAPGGTTGPQLYAPDPHQPGQQHLPSSRLQHMTSPYFLPHQQALMVNNNML